MELFRFENVSYTTLDKKFSLKNINWTINNFENWIILGANGSGKTTLLKMIYGFIRPNETGCLYWRGELLPNLYELRKSIGFISNFIVEKIPHSEKVFDTVISGRFAMLGYWEYAQPYKGIIEQAEQLLIKFNCAQFRDREFTTLSQGERQLIMLIRCLMAEPYLIILDEPCAGLDVKNREFFLKNLAVIMQENKNIAFIFVTHHIDEIIKPFKKILMLKNGEIIKQGDIDSELTEENLQLLFDIDLKLVKFKNRYSLIFEED